MKAQVHHLRTDVLADEQPELAERVSRVFGHSSDPIEEVERRAQQLLSDVPFIVWEGDAQTFQFSYVSDSASDIVGYACAQWLTEPAFWAETVVHPEDRNHSIAFCALSTANKRDHDFEYRARRPGGSVVWLHDIVRVIVGKSGIAERLRGIMIEVTAQKHGGQ